MEVQVRRCRGAEVQRSQRWCRKSAEVLKWCRVTEGVLRCKKRCRGGKVNGCEWYQVSHPYTWKHTIPTRGDSGSSRRSSKRSNMLRVRPSRHRGAEVQVQSSRSKAARAEVHRCRGAGGGAGAGAGAGPIQDQMQVHGEVMQVRDKMQMQSCQ